MPTATDLACPAVALGALRDLGSTLGRDGPWKGAEIVRRSRARNPDPASVPAGLAAAARADRDP